MTQSDLEVLKHLMDKVRAAKPGSLSGVWCDAPSRMLVRLRQLARGTNRSTMTARKASRRKNATCSSTSCRRCPLIASPDRC